jgi:hypothetical protein
MKKLLLIVILFAAVCSAKAQNIQTHYDMGKDRGYLTTTIEMFKVDKLGNTFFFVDFDYGVNGVKGVSTAYMEIARCFKIADTPISAHFEYDGGFGQYMPGAAFQINDAFLAGVDYSWNAKDYSKGFSLKALYKNIRGLDNNHSFQFTAVWYAHFFDKKISFTGFADVWKEKSDFGQYKFIAEPQLWFNMNETFSIGGELEMGYNFVDDGFKANPTIAAKWNF